MHTAVEDLKLDRLDLVQAGDGTFPLAPKIRAVSGAALWQELEPLGQ